MLKILINTSVVTLYFAKTILKWQVSLEQLIQPTGPVYISEGNLKMAFSLWNLTWMYSVHIMPEKFENATITVSQICQTQSNHIIIITSSFLKSSVFKMFSIHAKMRFLHFQIHPVEELFWKALFWQWINEDKAAFSNFSSVVWQGLKCLMIS